MANTFGVYPNTGTPVDRVKLDDKPMLCAAPLDVHGVGKGFSVEINSATAGTVDASFQTKV